MRISDWSSDVCSSDLISPSAISYHVKALEEHLGVTLFERVGNGVALTRAGRKYLNMVQAALGQIEEAGSFLSDAGEETLTIRVAISFLERWLLPNLPDFKIGRASCRERVCQYV